MACITSSDGKNLNVGRDFVDAVTMQIPASHGEMEINGKVRYAWQSTLTIADTESALRKAAQQEGKRVTLFISQAA